MTTQIKRTEDQTVQQVEQSVFDVASERSLDYTNMVVGHVFENIVKKEKSSFVMMVLGHLIPSFFSSSPESVAKRYHRIQGPIEK